MTTPDFLPILSHGSHYSPEAGACVMEMVSFLAGEEFTDRPECVATPIQNEAISINDLVSDDNRSQIALMIPRLMNTDKLNGNNDFYNEMADARVDFLKERNLNPKESVAHAIKHAFTYDEGEARRTNQEYDQIGIDWLGIVLDLADKHLGRNQPSTEAVEAVLVKTLHHISQVNA